MRRLSVALMLGGLAVGTIFMALPAAAASVATCQKEEVLGPNGIYIDKVEAFADTIAMQLRQMGYRVSMVEPWGGCVKATIEDGGGREHMEFFDPDTLEPLTTN